MTYATPRGTTGRRPNTVDIADVAWPVFKVEALTLGMLVFVGALALASSLQFAVLTSAATTVVAWWTLRFAELRAHSRHPRA